MHVRAAGTVAVVIPARNESARIGPTLAMCRTFLARPPGGTLIVVDNDSTDGTAALAQKAGAAVVFEPVQGKGAAVRAGVLAALERTDAGLILVTDADGPVRLDLGLPPLLDAIRDGADIAIGSRALPGAVLDPPQPLHRRLAGRLFALWVRATTGLPYADTQCGFKLFTRNAAARIFPPLHETGFAWDIEFLLRAQAEGLRVVEIPVPWGDRPGSTVRWARDGIRIVVKVWTLGKEWQKRPYTLSKQAGLPAPAGKPPGPTAFFRSATGGAPGAPSP